MNKTGREIMKFFELCGLIPLYIRKFYKKWRKMNETGREIMKFFELCGFCGVLS